MNNREIEELFIIRMAVFRIIEYSNVQILIKEIHNPSRIPRVGEHVNGQKVQDVNYRIEGVKQDVELELEPEIRTHHHLKFDEAKTLIHGCVKRASGRRPLPQVPHNDLHTIYEVASPFLNKDEKLITADQFDTLFPAVKASDQNEGPDKIQSTGFWKSLFDKR